MYLFTFHWETARVCPNQPTSLLIQLIRRMPNPFSSLSGYLCIIFFFKIFPFLKLQMAYFFIPFRGHLFPALSVCARLFFCVTVYSNSFTWTFFYVVPLRADVYEVHRQRKRVNFPSLNFLWFCTPPTPHGLFVLVLSDFGLNHLKDTAYKILRIMYGLHIIH